MQALQILFGALFTVAVATAAGALLLRDACKEHAVRFVVGAAALSAVVFAACAARVAYAVVLAALGGALLWAAGLPGPLRVWDRRRAVDKLNWKYKALLLWFSLYFILYFFNSMAPEASFDGARYHLGLVSRYLREHGFARITDNMYAGLSQGVEMLYLYAFAFGRHSAAAMVHFAFLAALAWEVFAYGRRAGSQMAGACAALLVFASPVVGVDGTSAYNDVAVAAIGFTLFYLLQLWEEKRTPRLLAAIGLVAGFGYAAKYTAWLAAPYALGFVAWKSRRARDVLVVGACAAILIAPWMVKDWMWLDNPVAPFFNRVFPNRYVTVAFEEEYRQHMSRYGIGSRAELPLQATVYGSLSGLVGPVFLLAPVALLALRRREGRQLLLAAAVFGAGYASNIGTRFLIPALPFVALAMALALERAPGLTLAIALTHAAISWPPIVTQYCHGDAWRLSKVPWREALRIKPEDAYLESHLFYYGAARLVEQAAAPGSTVFAFIPIPQAYTSRWIRVAYESAENTMCRDILWTAFVPEHEPAWRLRFAFPRQRLRAVRVVQTNSGSDQWSIHELRVWDGASELKREAQWRLDAQPYPWGIENAFDGRPMGPVEPN